MGGPVEQLDPWRLFRRHAARPGRLVARVRRVTRRQPPGPPPAPAAAAAAIDRGIYHPRQSRTRTTARTPTGTRFATRTGPRVVNGAGRRAVIRAGKCPVTRAGPGAGL